MVTRDFIRGYRFRTHLIEESDVLLCTNPQSKSASLIKIATGGSFSHVAMCTFKPNFLEANDPGVGEFSLDRKAVLHRKNIRFLRLKRTIANRAEVLSKVASNALACWTTHYSTINAIASVVPILRRPDDEGYFCSKLVAEAYENAGLNITSSGKTPDRTTPADVEHSPCFEDITDTILVPAEFDPLGPQVNFFDGPPIGDAPQLTPAEQELEALRKVTGAVSIVLRAHGKPPVSVYSQAQSAFMEARDEPWFPELDTVFYDMLRAYSWPIVIRGYQLVADARAEDLARIRFRAGVIEPAILREHAIYLMHRIDTTGRLLAQREPFVEAFRSALPILRSKTVGYWLVREWLIVRSLKANLAMYRNLAA